MITINYEDIELSVTQRGTDVKMQRNGMNGRIVLAPEEGRAWFMETTHDTIPRNPIVMRGKRLKLRVNSDGRIRGTFMLDGIANEDIEDVGREIDSLIVDLQREYGVKSIPLLSINPIKINL